MLAYKYTDKLASLSTNVSQDAVDSFIRKGASSPGRMIVVSNGIDASQFDFSMDERKAKRSELGIFNDTPILLSVGRLTEAKDYPNLLTAFSLLIKDRSLQSFPQLFIVGTGHLDGYLKNMSKEFGIDKYVTFIGQRNDIRQLMCAADIFVLSSEWEGFPLVITEAMACKKIIVATDAGGITEALGDCGSIVPIKDPNSLSQAINKMIKLSDNQKEILGNKARERIIQTNSIETIIERWLSIYTQFKK
ncbi:TPA: glycosyltransferase [Yersinia enterocolitica]|nr:glycosyltransferase [Yersinia enterocolitica]